MRGRHFLRYIVVAALAGLLMVFWLVAPERITVRAIGAVPLFDPMSLAGGVGDGPKPVAQLNPGEELEVIECVDTKTDVNLQARYRGQVVVIGEWKAPTTILRRHAYPWEHGATSSCRGLFGSGPPNA